mgnify:CR=1 FL=1
MRRIVCICLFQAEGGIRDLVRSRGLGDVYKRQNQDFAVIFGTWADKSPRMIGDFDSLFYDSGFFIEPHNSICLLYTSDAADERSSVDLGGRRIIQKKNNQSRYRFDDDIGIWFMTTTHT